MHWFYLGVKNLMHWCFKLKSARSRDQGQKSSINSQPRWNYIPLPPPTHISPSLSTSIPTQEKCLQKTQTQKLVARLQYLLFKEDPLGFLDYCFSQYLFSFISNYSQSKKTFSCKDIKSKQAKEELGFHHHPAIFNRHLLTKGSQLENLPT